MLEKKQWENLTKEEQQKWNDKADEANKLGLGLFAKTVGVLLEDGTLILKDNKLMISGSYAFKMKQETGISPEALNRALNEIFNKMIPK